MKHWKKQVSKKDLSKTIICGMAAAVLSVPCQVMAAPAVPAPGESIERPQLPEEKPVVDENTEGAAAAVPQASFHLQSISVNHEGMKLKDEDLTAITKPLLGRQPFQ